MALVRASEERGKLIRVYLDGMDVTRECFEAYSDDVTGDGYVYLYLRDEAPPHSFMKTADGLHIQTRKYAGKVRIERFRKTAGGIIVPEEGRA